MQYQVILAYKVKYSPLLVIDIHQVFIPSENKEFVTKKTHTHTADYVELIIFKQMLQI